MIKNWSLFLESYSDEVSDICKKYYIREWYIEDGLVNVDGTVNLNELELIHIPIKFGKVNNFSCVRNKLISLENSPIFVRGNFLCDYNELVSLEYAPKRVNGSFWCEDNSIVNLNGLGRAMSGFFANNNPIKRLSDIGNGMINLRITFIESAIKHRNIISKSEWRLIEKSIDASQIANLPNIYTDFKLLNFIRTYLPEKWIEFNSNKILDVSADLGELGF